MRAILALAVTRRYIGSNPADAVKLPKKGSRTKGRARQIALTAEEVRKLVDAMPEHWRLPVKVAAFCGLRAGELWALRRADVDPLHGQLHVVYAIKDIRGSLEAGPTKTHAQRKLSIPAFLRAELEQALTTPPRPTPKPLPGRRARKNLYPAIKAGELTYATEAADPARLLFTTPSGTPVQHVNFYERVFRPVVVKLWPEGNRLHGLRWHDLRHTCASLSLAVTPNLHIVKERLGHEDIRTTVNIYGHMVPSVDEALADALGVMWDATATSVGVKGSVVGLAKVDEG
jgi:integrase